MDEKTITKTYDTLRVPHELGDKIRVLAEQEKRTILAMIEVMYEAYVDSINSHQK